MGEPITMTLSSVVCWPPDAFAATVDGRVVLMSQKHGNYYDLGGIGSNVWQRLAMPVRVEVLCRALTEEYEGDPLVIQRDVMALLGRLAEDALVEVRGG
ncbi:MAG: PqqD family peptide modification chaperone [bacterium]